MASPARYHGKMYHAALYPGSFDPLTNGHMDVIRQGMNLFERLVIAVGTHHEKRAVFDAGARCALIGQALGEIARPDRCHIEIVRFGGLVVDAMAQNKTGVLLRGLRDTTDYNYEMQMAGMNATLSPQIQLVFVPGSPDVRHIAASLVRQIVSMGGDIAQFVPQCVVAPLQRKFSRGTMVE